MSDVIKLLSENVANQIAAGEVIQRPASVVKELLDNAIDAGATDIQLIIREGGKTWIQLLDNGKGMSATDARMCWERHATSKISKTEDIYHIKTMGFRGEALASIASVAQVEMKTKTKDEAIGTFISIEGSEVLKQESIATETGTNITVKNLFYNIPARRNFLKSNPVETKHIYEEFARAVLAHPEITFTLHNNNEEVYFLKKTTLEQRIAEYFSIKTSEQLLAVEEETTIAKIHGFVGKPEFAKKTRGDQYFFVNNRFIKDAYLNHAVFSCYENLISKEQFPFYVIFISIDPAQIDVNIHPTKTEIKFEDERSLYQILKAVCKKAIGEHYHAPTYTPNNEDTFINFGATPLAKSTETHNRTVTSTDAFYQPTNAHQTFSKNKANTKDWQELFGILNKEETIKDVSPRGFERISSELELNSDSNANTKNFMQLHGAFVLTQVKSGILLVDIQAAHERILFDKYVNAMHNHPIASQQKLFPKSITLSHADSLLFNEILPDIKALGFDINNLGGNTYAINGLPAELNHNNELHLIEEVLENYKQQQTDKNKQHNIAKVLAQRAAIRVGTKLDYEEMNTLVDELFSIADNKTSPSGKSCFKIFSIDQLYKLIQ
ncbi:MAG: DNA mismatch repair endonuclease MutL [Bacteroidia bacterium]|nr:DNA mismatch repair endonuclease MutL [Bacteroidia bacterium]MCZ2140575.1 DNA mismatch repair endonuclease MutL [Bacteroidia bacterium]